MIEWFTQPHLTAQAGPTAITAGLHVIPEIVKLEDALSPPSVLLAASIQPRVAQGEQPALDFDQRPLPRKPEPRKASRETPGR